MGGDGLQETTRKGEERRGNNGGEGKRIEGGKRQGRGGCGDGLQGNMRKGSNVEGIMEGKGRVLIKVRGKEEVSEVMGYRRT